MLLTSRGIGRWVIPKGWPMVGRKPRVVAVTEARQEAGIKGIISRKPIGSYHYAKTLDRGEERLCECIVFLMLVTHEAPPGASRMNEPGHGFPEMRQRNSSMKVG
jgi:8-oxo-dGTP pyrophosphatase MutT (NUDIX family)